MGWGKQSKVVLQTLGVSYRVSQCRESDTRPVRGDNEETEAQPQSHMKGIFRGWVEVLFPWSPSTLRHTHTDAPSITQQQHTLHHTLCLSLSFTHTHVAPLLSLILTKTKQAFGSCDIVVTVLSLCVFLAAWVFSALLSQTVYHPLLTLSCYPLSYIHTLSLSLLSFLILLYTWMAAPIFCLRHPE